jgi:hypothetical protein
MAKRRPELNGSSGKFALQTTYYYNMNKEERFSDEKTAIIAL